MQQCDVGTAGSALGKSALSHGINPPLPSHILCRLQNIKVSEEPTTSIIRAEVQHRTFVRKVGTSVSNYTESHSRSNNRHGHCRKNLEYHVTNSCLSFSSCCEKRWVLGGHTAVGETMPYPSKLMTSARQPGHPLGKVQFVRNQGSPQDFAYGVV